MDRETFEQLHRQAEQRVISQQKKAEGYTNPKPKEPDAQPKTDAQKPAPVIRKQSKELINLLNLKNIGMSSDRALIMGLILLLANEDADEWLLLALVYVML